MRPPRHKRKVLNKMQITAGTDASMDVLATLFVCFVLLLALSILLSGGKAITAEQNWLIIISSITSEESMKRYENPDTALKLLFENGEKWSIFTKNEEADYGNLLLPNSNNDEPPHTTSVLKGYYKTDNQKMSVTWWVFNKPKFGTYKIELRRGLGMGRSFTKGKKACLHIYYPYQKIKTLDGLCEDIKFNELVLLEKEFNLDPREIQ